MEGQFSALWAAAAAEAQRVVLLKAQEEAAAVRGTTFAACCLRRTDAIKQPAAAPLMIRSEVDFTLRFSAERLPR